MIFAPRKSPTLTEAELRLMEVLWPEGASHGAAGRSGFARKKSAAGLQLRSDHDSDPGKKRLCEAR